MASAKANSDGEESEELKTAKEEEQVFGERLLDDLMNTFCDQLQRSNSNLEGLLAIQYILTIKRASTFWERMCCCRTIDADDVRKHISGKKVVLQIIYDAERVHYVALGYSPITKCVTLYDSLSHDDIDNLMTETVCKQIQTIFGHLFAQGEVVVQVELNYERQQDNWSCGYRAVACVTDLARGQDPAGQSYNLGLIYSFLLSVLCNPKKVNWSTFENASIAKISQESRSARALRLFFYAWSLAIAVITSRPRETDSSTVKLLLRPDGSYTVKEGAEKMRKAGRRRSESSAPSANSPTEVASDTGMVDKTEMDKTEESRRSG